MPHTIVRLVHALILALQVDVACAQLGQLHRSRLDLCLLGDDPVLQAARFVLQLLDELLLLRALLLRAGERAVLARKALLQARVKVRELRGGKRLRRLSREGHRHGDGS